MESKQLVNSSDYVSWNFLYVKSYSTHNVIFYNSILSYRALILTCFFVYKLYDLACIVCFVYLEFARKSRDVSLIML